MLRDDQIIIKPHITEKTTNLRESQNKYVFIVHKNANKIMIKNAIKKIFNIMPLDVNVINIKGKGKRVRYKYGFTSSFKKAVVTLKKGDKIAIFEGA
ncbi:MAG: 50S ribosomal protein L23 [Spirochaetes bacterium]|nr:50S ribosomal protein L23 [Spirochaetota bacterium]